MVALIFMNWVRDACCVDFCGVSIVRLSVQVCLAEFGGDDVN